MGNIWQYFGNTMGHQNDLPILGHQAIDYFGQLRPGGDIEPLKGFVQDEKPRRFCQGSGNHYFSHLTGGQKQNARALVKAPQLLILDEPFEGLDVASRSQLAEIINHLMVQERQIILVTHRLSEILPNISHVMGLRKGKVFFQGKRQEHLSSDQIERLYPSNLFQEADFPTNKPQEDAKSLKIPDVLVKMKDTTVKYKDTVILDQLNWEMKSGENWAIIGPNGAGKTTLLSLIAGDNLQA